MSSLIRSIKGYWPLDDEALEKRREVTGHGDKLAPTGAVARAAGKIGSRYAASFTSAGGYLSAPSSANNEFGGTRSYALWAWFKIDALTGAVTLFGKAQEYILTWFAAGVNAFQFDLYYALPNGFYRLRTGAITAGTWHLVMVQVDLPNLLVTLYLDNVSAATQVITTLPRADTADLTMGAATGGTAYVDGPGIAACVLTSDERDAIWNSGSGADYPWGLTAPLTRELSTAFSSFLDGETLTLAVCIKLTRADGTVYGFTSHDADLTFGGTTYEALSSVQATAVRSQLTTGIDNLDVVGLLQSDRITEADLEAGVYDGATVALYLVNWADLTMGTLTLLRGSLGAVTIKDGQYTAELRSLAQRLQQSVGDLTTPLCRVKALGDSQCTPSGTFGNGNTLATDYTFTRAVASAIDGRQMTFAADSHATGFYSYGKVTFATGPNAGLSREIKQHTLSGGQAVLVLSEGFPYTPAAGNSASLVAGCDRRKETCIATFGNIVSFRGEPYSPGSDKILKRGRRA